MSRVIPKILPIARYKVVVKVDDQEVFKGILEARSIREAHDLAISRVPIAVDYSRITVTIGG